MRKKGENKDVLMTPIRINWWKFFSMLKFDALQTSWETRKGILLTKFLLKKKSHSELKLISWRKSSCKLGHAGTIWAPCIGMLEKIAHSKWSVYWGNIDQFLFWQVYAITNNIKTNLRWFASCDGNTSVHLRSK